MAMTVVRCMPPSSEGKIRSSRESVGLGTPPWEIDLETKGTVLGAESLWVRFHTCHDKYKPCHRYHALARLSDRVRSERNGDTYFACKPHCWMFTGIQYTTQLFLAPERRALIQAYTYLMTLAFEPDEFYPPECVELSIMPPLPVQQKYFALFRQRVHDTMRETVGTQHPLTGIQAEQKVWQQLEEELKQSISSFTKR